MSTHKIGFFEAILMSTHNVGFYEEISLRYTMVVHVYVAIMHECQRVHYRTYTCTNHGISDLHHYNQPMSSYS